MLDVIFTASITKDDVNSGWTCVIWPESATVLGTRKAVKVSGTVDGHDFQATLMPFGDDTHMLPLRAALRKTIQKDLGDTVEVVLKERL